MANQRMYIRCNACGDTRALARRMFSTPFEAYTGQPETLDQWFAKHGQFGMQCGGDDVGADAFEIVYECAKDYETAYLRKARA